MVNKRLLSLDVFRGMTIAAMILVNNIEGQTYSQLRHSAWDGLTFTDTIFPFFLWIIGVAMVFSFKRRLDQKTDKTKLLLHIFRRSLILFALGLFLNGFPYFNLGTIRIMGVLQRIALCYLFAGIIFLYTKLRGQILWTVLFLFGYWFLIKFVPVPGFGPGHLELQGNLAQYIDHLLLQGHLWASNWDPEGILSTIPAVATVMFGILTGQLLISEKVAASKKVFWLFSGSIALIICGLTMSIWLPINKSLWTSSYAILTAGLAGLVFSFIYFFVDLKGHSGWTKPFVIYGLNAITVYILSVLLTETLMIVNVGGISLQEFVYGFFLTLVTTKNATLILALTHVIVFYLVAYLLYRKKVFIKI